MSPGGPRQLASRLACTAVVAAALGYIEASIVVYLREIIAPVRAEHFPAAAREVLPLLSPQHLAESSTDLTPLLAVEMAREIAPLAILGGVAWALRRRKADAAGLFMLGFGIWDIFYYVFLKLLIDWPASLGTWDVLYLIPTAWVAPVWAPLAVSATLVAAGLAIVCRSRPPRPAQPLVAGSLIAAGIGMLLASFFTRSKEAFSAVPAQFDWPLFLAGWGAAVVGLLWLMRPRAVGRRQL